MVKVIGVSMAKAIEVRSTPSTKRKALRVLKWDSLARMKCRAALWTLAEAVSW